MTGPMVRLKDPPAPHFFVQSQPIRDADDRVVRRARAGCARVGCGLPSEHPVHLRPPGDAPADERIAVNA